MTCLTRIRSIGRYLVPAIVLVSGSASARAGTEGEVHSELRQLRQEVNLLRQELTALRQELNQLRRPPSLPALLTPAAAARINGTIQPYAGQSPEDPAGIIARWKGPSPSVSLSIVGDASGRQVRICDDTLKRFGIRPPAEPAVEATVEVGASSISGRENIIKLTTQQRGVIQMYRPGWTVQKLCEDALAQALRIARSDTE